MLEEMGKEAPCDDAKRHFFKSGSVNKLFLCCVKITASSCF